jgi:archaellum biogenesis protein FlaJ (TadC family)
LISAFRGPYHAFFQKDLRVLRTWNGILSIVFLVMFGLGIMLFARITHDWQSFVVCFSIALFFAAGMLPLTLFECEVKPYRDYYTRQLRLRDEQIVAYKLPLQILIVVFLAFMLTLYDGFLHGFAASYLLVALGITVYCLVFCVSLGWWCVRRLKKGKDFNSLYQMASLAVFAIPGVMLVYALVSFLAMRSARSLRMRGSRHA